MLELDAVFARRKVNIPRLRDFGFSEAASGYSYTTTLMDGYFTMTVTVKKEGGIAAEVIENASGESYVLHRVAGATGAFVGQVREEYARVLAGIAEACFEPDVFKSERAQRILQYVRDTYQHEPEYLWERFPDNAIVRRQDNAKWYLLILTVQKKKLGLLGDGSIEIIDVRMKAEDVSALVDGVRYLPGYHMNKKYWVTLLLDGPVDSSVPLEELFARIDASFALAVK